MVVHLKLEEPTGVNTSFLIIMEAPEIQIALQEDPANQIVAIMTLVAIGANQDMDMTMSMEIISQVLSHPMIITIMGLVGIIKEELKELQEELFSSRLHLLSTENSLKLLFLLSHVSYQDVFIISRSSTFIL